MKDMKCPKCGGNLEKGIMLTPGAVVGVRWNKGEPSKLFNLVGKLPRINAYACDGCGFVENYVESK